MENRNNWKVGDRLVSFGFGVYEGNVNVATIKKQLKTCFVCEKSDGSTFKISDTGRVLGQGSNYQIEVYSTLEGENLKRFKIHSNLGAVRKLLVQTSNSIDRMFSEIKFKNLNLTDESANITRNAKVHVETFALAAQDLEAKLTSIMKEARK